MGEIITLHIGQAGVGIGEAFWEELIREHNLTLSPGGGLFHQDGPSSDPKTAGSGSQLAGHSYLNSFFHENRDGNLVPRSLFVDLDGSSLDAVKKGSLKGVFSQVTGFVGGKEDASDIYSRGHYTIGKELINTVEEHCRIQAEKCHLFEGLVLTHSVCGGTGSGLATLISERLSVLFSKKQKINYTLIPDLSSKESNIAAYNCTLAIHSLLEHSDLTVMLQNASIMKCLDYNLGIEEVRFGHANRLISHHAANMFAGLRYKSGSFANLAELVSGIVPYPRIHFPAACYSPWVPKGPTSNSPPNVFDSTFNIFEPLNCLSSVPILKHRLMSSSFMFRGDVPISECHAATNMLQSSKWNIVPVDFCPVPFSVGRTPLGYNKPRADMSVDTFTLSTLTNSIGCMAPLEAVANRFDILYAKRAFVHWYVGEGMSEGEFSEAREDLAALCKDCEDWGWNGIEQIANFGPGEGEQE